MTEAHVTVIDFHTLSPLNSPASTSLHWLLHCFAHVWCHICPFQSVVPDCRLHTGGIITASSYIKSLLPRSVDWNHQLWLSTFSWMNDPHIHGFPSGTPATGRSDMFTWSLVNEHYSSRSSSNFQDRPLKHLRDLNACSYFYWLHSMTFIRSTNKYCNTKKTMLLTT